MTWFAKENVADALTLGNALAGFLAMTYVADGRFTAAALLIFLAALLDGLDGWAARRRGNAAWYDHRLRGIPGITTPVALPENQHVYHQYTIRVVSGDRDAFAQRLQEQGVGSGVYYPIPTHRLPSFGLDVDLPETERAAREVLSLPVHPALSQADLERIVEVVNKTARAGS